MRTMRGRRPGFTLVEAIAAMTVLSVLAGLSSMLMYSAVVASRDVSVQGQLHEEVSTAMEQVARALREIPAVQKGAVLAPAIDQVTPSSIHWGTSTLSLSGTELHLVEDGVAAILLRDVTAFSIQCYDDTNAPLPGSISGAGTGEIQRVAVLLTISRSGVSETLQMRVFIRSLMVGATP